MQKVNWKKYIYTLLITMVIFATAFYIANYINEKRILEIKSIQDSITTDLISSETQFSLLSELSCLDVDSGVLSRELNNIASRIEFSEKNIGTDNKEILQLKKTYSLLQIKDYLLMKKISERCGNKFAFILYFYTNETDCEDCNKTAYVLTSLREKYPQLRVYSFDYNLDLSALKTLISIFKIKDDLPAIVLGGKVIGGFQEKEVTEKILKEAYPRLTTTAATSTKK